MSTQEVVASGYEQPGSSADPVTLDITGLFQAKFACLGSDLFIGGQPTEKALRDLKAKGVTTVINLRMPEEMTQIGFDEAGPLRIPTARNNSINSLRRWHPPMGRCCCIAQSRGARATSGRRT